MTAACSVGRAFVWTWAEGQPAPEHRRPGSNESCAVARADDGRWETRPCQLAVGEDQLPTACKVWRHDLVEA